MTFDGDAVAFAMLLFAAFAATAMAYATGVVVLGVWFGSKPTDPLRAVLWAAFALPPILAAAALVFSGEPSGLYLLPPVALPVLFGWAGRRQNRRE